VQKYLAQAREVCVCEKEQTERNELLSPSCDLIMRAGVILIKRSQIVGLRACIPAQD